jgi:serine protease Do
VVLDFNHQTVPDVRALMRMAGETMPGTKVTLTVWRNGASLDQDVTLAQFPEEGAKSAMPKPPSTNPDATPDYGLHLAAISSALRRQYKLAASARGVVVTKIDTDGEAADTNLSAGDVIVKAENQQAKSPNDVFVALKAAHETGKDSGILLIRHDGDFRFVGIHLVGKR